MSWSVNDMRLQFTNHIYLLSGQCVILCASMADTPLRELSQGTWGAHIFFNFPLTFYDTKLTHIS